MFITRIKLHIALRRLQSGITKYVTPMRPLVEKSVSGIFSIAEDLPNIIKKVEKLYPDETAVLLNQFGRVMKTIEELQKGQDEPTQTFMLIAKYALQYGEFAQTIYDIIEDIGDEDDNRHLQLEKELDKYISAYKEISAGFKNIFKSSARKATRTFARKASRSNAEDVTKQAYRHHSN